MYLLNYVWTVSSPNRMWRGTRPSSVARRWNRDTWRTRQDSSDLPRWVTSIWWTSIRWFSKTCSTRPRGKSDVAPSLYTRERCPNARKKGEWIICVVKWDSDPFTYLKILWTYIFLIDAILFSSKMQLIWFGLIF